MPAAVRRAVFARDQGRCQFKLASGEICGSTFQVQLHHLIPEAQGGPSTEGNLICACRPHNLAAARQDYGEDFMARWAPRPPVPPPRRP